MGTISSVVDVLNQQYPWNDTCNAKLITPQQTTPPNLKPISGSF